MNDDTDWARLLMRVRACTACVPHLPLGPRPILSASPTARLLITSQAPGRRAHEAGRTFADASGDRLRAWLGLTPEQFYDSTRIAIVPMGFCYPGTMEDGGDILPAARCSATWHAPLLAHLTQVKLTLLVGRLTQERYLPEYIPLPHPSWRTLGWARKNAWFEAEMLPELRARIAAILK